MIRIELINCAQDPTQIVPEISAAEQIKEQFETEFKKYPEAKGTLYILRSISIFGYAIRDIDLLLIGNFENFCFRRQVTSKNYGRIKNLYIDSFICNIELKDITSITNPRTEEKTLWKQGTAYHYIYSRSGEKNITEQAFLQQNEFRKYMKDNMDIEPFMCNLLWFRALNNEQLESVRGNEQDNALANRFKFKDFLYELLLQMNVYRSGEDYHLNCSNWRNDDISKLIRLLCEKREVTGLTKKKFELLSQEITDLDSFTNGVGEKFTLLSGRAGTGKTIQLMQLAYHLANPQNNKRCLLLTYNNALVSDIRRLIDFSNMPIGLDGRTVSIQTVDSFFTQLMIMFEVVNRNELIPTSRYYKRNFESSLTKFYDNLIKDLDDNDVQSLKDLVDSHIDWDYIFIDEGQDWPDLHKKVLFKLYGPSRIVVADGVDQFMMTSRHQNWIDTLKKDQYNRRKEMTVNLRQKNCLVEFLNAFSSILNLGWEMKVNRNLVGGQIDIYNSYNNNIHNDLLSYCKESGCEAYDILILVPPSTVEKNENGSSYFKNKEAYDRAGISIFDGTNSSNRQRYPTKDQSRVFQYDSCRGLEGWVTVCYQLDELIKYKMETINQESMREQYQGLDIETGIKKFIYTWVLMPLTRPIDRLVITLKDTHSEIGEILLQMSKNFEMINWNIN